MPEFRLPASGPAPPKAIALWLPLCIPPPALSAFPFHAGWAGHSDPLACGSSHCFSCERRPPRRRPPRPELAARKCRGADGEFRPASRAAPEVGVELAAGSSAMTWAAQSRGSSPVSLGLEGRRGLFFKAKPVATSSDPPRKAPRAALARPATRRSTAAASFRRSGCW